MNAAGGASDRDSDTVTTAAGSSGFIVLTSCFTKGSVFCSVTGDATVLGVGAVSILIRGLISGLTAGGSAAFAVKFTHKS